MSFSLPAPEILYFVIHDDTGTVLRIGHCRPEHIDGQALPGEHLLVTATEPDAVAGVYVVDGQLLPCQPIQPRVLNPYIQADGADLCTIENLPPGCTVFAAGAVVMPEVTVAGTSCAFSSTTPGEISVYISKRPTHRQAVVTIHVR